MTRNPYAQTSKQQRKTVISCTIHLLLGIAAAGGDKDISSFAHCQESNFIVPHNEHVHHSFSMNVPHSKQFQPSLPFAGSKGVAD